LKIFQSSSAYIEVENRQEEEKLKRSLTFELDGFKKEGTVLEVFEQVKGSGRKTFVVPRYTHTLFETKHKRLKIERDNFTSIKVKFPKFLLSLRDEQIKAVEAYLAHDDDNVLVLPPASGKTILAAYIASQLQEKTIILVHRGAFFNVWKADICKAFNIEPSEIGEIREDKMTIGKQFTLATFQTLHSRNLDVYDKFGLVIGDECLVGSTRIDMQDGTKKLIRDIKNGDIVKGGLVSNKFMKVVPETICVSAEGYSYEGSPNHPIIVVDIVDVQGDIIKRYDLKRVKSKDLKLGDLLAVRISKKRVLELNRKRTKEGKVLFEVFYRGRVPFEIVNVDHICIESRPCIVYDFTTESHTFIANGILSSNCHHVPSETFSAVMSKFTAKHILGVTGTFERTDGLHVLTNLFMGRIAYYNNEADMEHVELANIFRIDTDVTLRVSKGENIHTMYHKMMGNSLRYRTFLELFDLCYQYGRKQLVFTHSVTYAKLYAALLVELGYRVMLSIGGDDTRNQLAKQLMLEGKLDAIVATVAYLKEGESINILDTLHILTPITNRIDWTQSIARGQRKHEDKQKVIVFDYVDNRLERCMRYLANRMQWSSDNNSHRYTPKAFDEKHL
jgi:superfamily II DNA or RNA helicase